MVKQKDPSEGRQGKAFQPTEALTHQNLNYGAHNQRKNY